MYIRARIVMCQQFRDKRGLAFEGEEEADTGGFEGRKGKGEVM